MRGGGSEGDVVVMRLSLVLGGCGILNSVAVSVFSRPKTEVSVLGLVLALKYVKICKSA